MFADIVRDWELLQERGEEIRADWWPSQDPRWLAGMCERVGVPVPADVDGTVRASHAHVLAHIRCAYPDATPAVRALHAIGVRLHLASGGHTDELEPYLRRMGIRELIAGRTASTCWA
ncbi:MAG TPA: HAD family hydrolase [Candidatus Limnocylindria bacterium]|nr:HAD family hydrolase [Candidatus Limnocylindria bacterium]